MAPAAYRGSEATRVSGAFRFSAALAITCYVRGNIAQEVYELSNSAASCSRSSFNALYESHVCPLSFVVWQPDLLPEAAE